MSSDPPDFCSERQWFWREHGQTFWVAFSQPINELIEAEWAVHVPRSGRRFAVSIDSGTGSAPLEIEIDFDNRIARTRDHSERLIKRIAFGTPSTPSQFSVIPVTFVWPLGGSVVLLKGSFDGWRGSVPMRRAAPGEPATCTLLLESGHVYEYKFLVDGQWLCREDEPKMSDKDGNQNNFISVELPPSLLAPD